MATPAISTDRLDALISSIANLYIALLSFTFIYLYAGWIQIRHNDNFSALEALDKLIVTREVSYKKNKEPKPLKFSDIPNFFERAIEDILESDMQGFDPDSYERNFPDRDASSGTTFSHHMRLTGRCTIAQVELMSGHTFKFTTYINITRSFSVPSQSVSVLFFSRSCTVGAARDFSALIFRDNEHVAVALPTSLLRVFPTLSRAMSEGAIGGPSHFPFQQLEVTRALLPAFLYHYARFDDAYDIVHIREVEESMLRHAITVLNRYFAFAELDDAISKLYDNKKETAALFGVTLEVLHLLRLGPILLFGITFELWRRIRQIPPAKLHTEKLWFALDTGDMIGKITAWLMSLFPFLASLGIYTVFAYSQELALVAWSKVLSFSRVFGWNLLNADDYAQSDNWAFFWWIAFWFHCLILLLLTIRLLRIVDVNSGVTIVGTFQRIRTLALRLLVLSRPIFIGWARKFKQAESLNNEPRS